MIARLLHYANASPPFPLRQEFYALKADILKKHGTPDGWDIQQVGKDRVCWGCEGSGIWESWSGTHTDLCDRCGGTGWYSRVKWVKLNRYRFGRYTFHIPGERFSSPPTDGVPVIQGLIQHPYYGRKSDTAFATLCLLTGRFGLLWLSVGYPCGWTWHPWLILKKAVSATRWKFCDWSSRCGCCRRRVWKSNILICDKCASSESIPF